MERNSAQEEAIRIHEGQVLLISCPGSGKTTTMIRRIHSMIGAGIPPASIVMVTFAEASAREMKERYHKSYGECGALFCTIHSLCLKILSRGSGKPPRILSTEDQISILRSIMKEARIPTATAAKDILGDISACKNSMSDFRTYSPAFLSPTEFTRLFPIYEEKKEQVGAMDFDDLLCKCLEILTQDTRLLEECQRTYRYIMCDEYQDTNHVQKEILYLLAGENGNLCVVGDDDQAIYGFRGATPGIMMGFKKDFPDVHEIYMNTNYRSRPEIIAAAKNLIGHNTERFEKDIRPARDGNGQVIFHSAADRQEGIRYLTSEMKQLQASGIPLSSIAVLSRTNQELEEIAAELENRHLEYHSNEPIRDIYEHFIFTDIMAYLNLIDGNFRTEYLLRILNRPSRYLKESAFRNVREFTKVALTEAAGSYPSQYHSAIDRIQKLYSDICSLHGKKLQEKVSGIANHIGYRKYLAEYADFTGQDKNSLWEKLDYYLTDSGHFPDRTAWSSAAASHIHNHHRKMKARTSSGITLSTMHRSKGLEWDIVFIINCCEGSIPFSKAETKPELEEERRLFYVAMTRAREKLYLLSHTSKPGPSNTRQHIKPSVFLSEIKRTDQGWNDRNGNPIRNQRLQRKETEKEFEEGDLFTLQEGMEVHHKTYGSGFVIRKTLSFVTVRFTGNDKIFFI